MSEENQELIFGKFKSMEEAEKGYKNAVQAFDKNAELSKKLDELTVVPEDYTIADDIQFENLGEIKTAAREAGLTQSAFEKMAKGLHKTNQSKLEQRQAEIKTIGDDQVNILKDYVSKNYPEKIADLVLDKMLSDKDMRNAALEHRNRLLNSKIPGSDNVTANRSAVSHDDVLKARQAMLKNPSDKKARDNYIKLLSESSKNKE